MGAGRGAQGDSYQGGLQQAQQRFAAAGMPYPGASSGNPGSGAGGGKGQQIAGLQQNAQKPAIGYGSPSGEAPNMSALRGQLGQLGQLRPQGNVGQPPPQTAMNFQSQLGNMAGNNPPSNWGMGGNDQAVLQSDPYGNGKGQANASQIQQGLTQMQGQQPQPQAPPPQAPPPVTGPQTATPQSAPQPQQVPPSKQPRAQAQALSQQQVRGLNRATNVGPMTQARYLANHQGVQTHLNKLQGGNAAQQQRAAKLGAPATGASGGKGNAVASLPR